MFRTPPGPNAPTAPASRARTHPIDPARRTRPAMKIPKRNLATAAVAFAAASPSAQLAAAASGGSDAALPPEHCVGTNLMPVSDRGSLRKNEGICRNEVTLGIGPDGTFGVWSGDVLVDEFARGIYKARLSESEDGSLVSLQAFRRRGDEDLAWSLDCDGLPGTGETKLTVHGEVYPSIVKLKQGTGELAEDLWRVRREARGHKLDDGGRCRIETHAHVHSTDAGFKMIVLEKNRRLCMGGDRRFLREREEGDRITLTECDADDERELFALDGRGRLHPYGEADLCVDAHRTGDLASPMEGSVLVLADCKTSSANAVWQYDRTGNRELSLRGVDGLCANYANGLMGASIAMERCSANAGWTFVSQEDYEVTGEEGDAYRNSRKLSRWRRLLDMDGS